MEGLEYWGNINILKGGIIYSDAITTVSPTYAREVLTPSMGMGLEGVLEKRKEKLRGVLNGIDYSIWDPLKDRELSANYGPNDMSGKMTCKKALIRESGLDGEIVDRPVVAMISRFDNQKGLDLVIEILDEAIDLGIGIVMLGEGNAAMERTLREKEKTKRGRMSVTTGFHESLAHRIMGGADMFLIPSRYEPCGLTQMYALKYGAVPVVRSTGGLDDTIVDFKGNKELGNGFKFKEYSSETFLRAIKRAVESYYRPSDWRQVVLNGMSADFSWNRSASSYMDLFRELMASLA